MELDSDKVEPVVRQFLEVAYKMLDSGMCKNEVICALIQESVNSWLRSLSINKAIECLEKDWSGEIDTDNIKKFIAVINDCTKNFEDRTSCVQDVQFVDIS